MFICSILHNNWWVFFGFFQTQLPITPHTIVVLPNTLTLGLWKCHKLNRFAVSVKSTTTMMIFSTLLVFTVECIYVYIVRGHNYLSLLNFYPDAISWHNFATIFTHKQKLFWSFHHDFRILFTKCIDGVYRQGT
jgi:hypothetical protein